MSSNTSSVICSRSTVTVLSSRNAFNSAKNEINRLFLGYFTVYCCNVYSYCRIIGLTENKKQP